MIKKYSYLIIVFISFLSGVISLILNLCNLPSGFMSIISVLSSFIVFLIRNKTYTLKALIVSLVSTLFFLAISYVLYYGYKIRFLHLNKDRIYETEEAAKNAYFADSNNYTLFIINLLFSIFGTIVPLFIIMYFKRNEIFKRVNL